MGTTVKQMRADDDMTPEEFDSAMAKGIPVEVKPGPRPVSIVIKHGGPRPWAADETAMWSDETRQWAKDVAPLAAETALSVDWIEDESLSRDEALARFNALNPEPTRGPHE